MRRKGAFLNARGGRGLYGQDSARSEASAYLGAIMIQGTGSSVGKSVVVTALCRIFKQDGFKVSPFKAQNMSLNSFVTKECGEMGRAQVVQAQACGLEPDVAMNPILLKPTGDKKAQVILQGRPAGNMDAREYIKYKKRCLKEVIDSFVYLKKRYEIIVIEGAGSPAEINLKKHDIVNMKMAEIADAPVILVGDIDKGGVFACLVGTLELLQKKERQRVKGFIINKFRGDKSLLKNGIRFLEKRTKKPVLGIIPYFKNIKIPEEDGVVLEEKKTQGLKDSASTHQSGVINIGVIKLPHISNFTDFDALEKEVDVRLSYINHKEELNGQDVLIIPGTKNTLADLIWLRRTGLADKILSTLNFQLSSVLIGICGGYQMLGSSIRDFLKIESGWQEIKGLGLLPIKTDFRAEKVLSQTKALHISSGLEVDGYEIHHGETSAFSHLQPVFKIKDKERFDGTQTDNGRIWGTYLHGVFDSCGFRRYFLDRIRKAKNLPPLKTKADTCNLEEEFDKLAALVRKNIDMKLLYQILNSKNYNALSTK